MRYEIKNITPPHDILAAMEKQMRAEREKRALILTSEGQRDAAINTAEGEKQQVIKASEGRKQQQINEAEGEAAAILAIADATANGLRKVADAITAAGRVRGGAIARRRKLSHRIRQARSGRQYPNLAGDAERRGLDDFTSDERHQTSGHHPQRRGKSLSSDFIFSN